MISVRGPRLLPAVSEDQEFMVFALPKFVDPVVAPIQGLGVCAIFLLLVVGTSCGLVPTAKK